MTFRFNLPTLVIAASIVLGLSVTSEAADDTAAFVAALRQRGFYDLTLDYLEDAKQDKLVSSEFKKRIPYERGVTLLGKWRVTPGASEKKRLVAQAREELEKFAETAKDNGLVAKALEQVASLLIQTADRDLAKLEQRPTTSTKAKATRQQARQNYEEGRKLLTKSEKLYSKELAKFPKILDPKKQSKEIDRRDLLRFQLSAVRVARSRLLHQQASTYDRKSTEAKKLYEKSAVELQSLYDKYSGYGIGLNARRLQGECYLDLQRYKEAIGCFEDVVVQSGKRVELRSSVAKAMQLQARAYLEQKQYATLQAKQGKWIEQSFNKNSTDPIVLAVKYQVAEAQRLQATLPETAAAAKRKLLISAKLLYQQVATERNEHQKKAREVLVSEFGGGAVARTEPETFDEALLVAKEAIRTISTAKQAIEAAKSNSPDVVPALKLQLQTSLDDAMRSLQLAQQLVDDDTPLLKINESRGLLCWLLWQDKQFHRSAVVASFLARRYPEDPSAASAARVAIVSYQTLYKQALEDKEYGDAGRTEIAQLKDLSRFITRRWGKTALADTAFGILLNFSIREKEFSEALQLIDKLEDSRQALFLAKVANAMWETQLRAKAAKDTSVDTDAMRTKAINLLQANFNTLKKDPASRDTLAASSLYLSQAHLEDEKYAAAIKLLEDPQAGAIALSKTNNAIASRPVYAIEAYKAALRAYVSMVPPKQAKVIATMASLEKAAKKTEGGNLRLTQVYLRIGVQLQRRIKALQEAGKANDAKLVSKSFITFLDKLSERGSDNPVVRRWVAQTYYQLAEGLEGDPSAEELRTTYYTQAQKSFKVLLDEADKKSTPAKKILALKMQYGQTLRRSGNYQEAVDLFESILIEKEAMIDVQKAAAYTLQEWGSASDSSKFAEATGGTGQRNAKGKPVIWGWNHLSKVAASVARSKPEVKEKFKDLFYECWLNMARIQYLKAQKASGTQKKTSLKKARQVIKTLVRNYSDMLQTDRADDFDKLAKEIQRAEGDTNPAGLKEFTLKKK